MSYAKLASSIIHSTIWREPHHVRIVWVSLMAMADERGIVESSIPGLAVAANVTLRECEEALDRLMSPDPYSRCKDLGGQRIVPVAGGWRLVSFEYYRQERDLEAKREKDALRQQRKRSRDKRDTSRTITQRPKSRPSEAEAKNKTEELCLPEECLSDSSSSELRRDPTTPTGTTDTVSPSGARAKAKPGRPKAAVPEGIQRLFDCHSRWMLEHRGAVHTVAPTKITTEAATTVLLAAGGNVERAEKLVELYVKLTEEEDPFIAKTGWAFRFLPERASRLAIMAARREETPSEQISRELREMVEDYRKQGLTNDEIRTLMSEEDLRRAGCWPLEGRRSA